MQRRFFRLAVVNILSNLMVPLAGLIDTAFLGHLVALHPLAGVALATLLFDYLYWSFGFLRMGTTGTTAQAMGREDAQEALLSGLRNWLLGLGLGLGILFLQYPLREAGFALLRATPDVIASGRAFYNAYIWAAPATLLNFVLVGWFLGREQSGRVLVLTALSATANIALDYLFIVHWGYESAGAGWATALSQYLMFIVGMIFVLQQVRWQQIRAVAARIPEPKAMKAAFVLNRDLLVRTFVLVSVFAVFTNLGSALGTEVLVTNAVLMQVFTLGAYFIDGLAFATESLAGFFKGQGKVQELPRLLRLSGLSSLGIGLGFALFFNLLPGPLFQLITDHVAVLGRLKQYVLWMIPVLGIGSVAFMLDGYFLGLTESDSLRRGTLTAALFGFAPVAFAAWYWQSSQLLWLALVLFMVGRVIALGRQVPLTLRPVQAAYDSHPPKD
ncbi:guanitoxin biosynthesis MATE family efflux transporter GntT [Anthocerotibacter panamensis]|uniref:guanitoxin biosynthesis MATE family efflux transporter GntT n=1 Tax=Anthocerotibacter panamensis TaxID=2857077 RepID=UPI001C40354E|nr:guanitoxin biosynthesis MATE family efflux transporter GntT [Anthocerotibacter panamensis]